MDYKKALAVAGVLAIIGYFLYKKGMLKLPSPGKTLPPGGGQVTLPVTPPSKSTQIKPASTEQGGFLTVTIKTPKYVQAVITSTRQIPPESVPL